MRYVARNAHGQICAVYDAPRDDAREALDPSHPDLRTFVGLPDRPAAGRLHESDLALVRVIEDLVDLLVDKGVILFTELPAPAQEKLLDRGRLRRALSAPAVVDDDELL